MPTMNLEMLKEFARSLISRKWLYVIEDIIDASDNIANDVDIFHVIFSHPSYESSQDSENFYLPYISFSREKHSIRRYTQPNDLRELDDSCAKNSEFHKFQRGHVTVFVKASVPLSEETKQLCRLFSDVCRLFYSTSDVSVNVLNAYGHKVTKEFSESGKVEYDLHAACEFISNKLGLEVCFLVPSGEKSFLPSRRFPLDGKGESLLGNKQVSGHVIASMQKRQRYSGRLTVDKNSYYYAIFPVLDPRLSPLSQRGAVFLNSINQPIDLGHTAAVSDLLSQVIVQQYLIGQPKCIRELQEMILGSSTAHELKHATRSQIESAISEFGRKCAKGLVNYSSAISAVVRLYNSFEQKLTPIAYFHTEHGHYSSGEPEPIDVNDWRDSVNAFCFRSNEPYVYIPNTNEIPDEFKQKGLRSIRRLRDNTTSEICFPITCNGLKLGTINIESSAQNAFDGDRPFFESVVQAFGDYLNYVNSREDAEWLSKLSFRHIIFHKTEDFTDKLSKRCPELLLDFQSLLQTVEALRDETTVISNDGIIDLDLLLNNIVQFSRDLQNSDEPVDIVHVAGESHLKVSAAFASSLRLIMESLLENSKIHTTFRDDYIAVSLNSQDHLETGSLANKKELQIEYNSGGLFPSSIVEGMFIAPLSADHKERRRYGLFLIGVHVRLLGGVFEIKTKDSELADHVYVKLLIRLPITRGLG